MTLCSLVFKMVDIASNFFRMSPIIKLMADAAFKSSKRLIRDFGEVERLQVSRKSVKDFVSTADLKSEATILEELRAGRSNFSFLTEESGKIDGLNRDECFIIDPLDGTINFLRGLQSWCISIAYAVDGVVQAGVVLDPLKNELFLAEKGKGAFVNGRRIRASRVNDIGDALVVSSRLDQGKHGKISDTCIGIRKIGSIALSLCYTAAGHFDAFVSNKNLKKWDIAAGTLIAQEAGCALRTDHEYIVSNVDLIDEFEKLLS